MEVIESNKEESRKSKWFINRNKKTRCYGFFYNSLNQKRF